MRGGGGLLHRCGRHAARLLGDGRPLLHERRHGCLHLRVVLRLEPAAQEQSRLVLVERFLHVRRHAGTGDLAAADAQVFRDRQHHGGAVGKRDDLKLFAASGRLLAHDEALAVILHIRRKKLGRAVGGAVHEHAHRHADLVGGARVFHRLRAGAVAARDSAARRDEHVERLGHGLHVAAGIVAQVNHESHDALPEQGGERFAERAAAVLAELRHCQIAHVAVDDGGGHTALHILRARHGERERLRLAALPGRRPQHGELHRGAGRAVELVHSLAVREADNLPAVDGQHDIAGLQAGLLRRGTGQDIHDLHIAVLVLHGAHAHAHVPAREAGAVFLIARSGIVFRAGIAEARHIAGAEGVGERLLVDLAHIILARLLVNFAELGIHGLALVHVRHLAVEAVHGVHICEGHRDGRCSRCHGQPRAE